MKETFKKILFALFATTMVIGFASCSDDDDNGKSFLNRNKKDCVCYVSFDEERQDISVSVENYEGDCKEIFFSDLGEDWEAWYNELLDLDIDIGLDCYEE